MSDKVKSWIERNMGWVITLLFFIGSQFYQSGKDAERADAQTKQIEVQSERIGKIEKDGSQKVRELEITVGGHSDMIREIKADNRALSLMLHGITGDVRELRADMKFVVEAVRRNP